LPPRSEFGLNELLGLGPQQCALVRLGLRQPGEDSEKAAESNNPNASGCLAKREDANSAGDYR
jgi:hypothetical protein